MTLCLSSKIASELDAEQRAAVGADEPAIAVLAGPGSGKTRTLSFRARHLLETHKTGNALLLTFTNKAAAEMKSRALESAKVPSGRLTASTFHTFCADVLRAHGELASINRDFEILDIPEARALQERVAKENSVPATYSVQFQRRRIRGVALSKGAALFGDLYQAAKAKAGVVDFDDLIVLVAKLFENRIDVAQAYAARFTHILVDEFQDTNALQLAVVQSIAKHAQTVSIFADDDQAIFGFAGAEPVNIRRFIDGFRAAVYPLTVNYRSGSNIVALANTIISATPGSSGRRMKAHHDGGKVEVRSFATLEDEASKIATEIAGCVAQAARTADIAVLVRSGWRANRIVEELVVRGVPVSDWRGDAYAPESRRILSACIAAVRGQLNARQIETLTGVMRVNATHGAMDTEQFIEMHATQPLAIGLSKMRDMVFQGAAAHEIAGAARDAVKAQDQELGASLDEIVNSVAQFEVYDKEFSLEHLLSELALGSLGRAPTAAGGVKVASLHRTKGLQWRVVYLVGLEEGHLPDWRSDTDSGLLEERRLLFVGVSRAEESLIITRCRAVNGRSKLPSRFLKEMGTEAH